MQTLLSALQSTELRELCSTFKYESQLAALEQTVETINAIFLDVENKYDQLNNQGKDWLAKLKDNQLLFTTNTSRKIKMIRKKLDSIARDRTQFGLSDVYIPVKMREDTFSYVHETSIIGRDADREAIMDMLLKA